MGGEWALPGTVVETLVLGQGGGTWWTQETETGKTLRASLNLCLKQYKKKKLVPAMRGRTYSAFFVQYIRYKVPQNSRMSVRSHASAGH